MDDPTGSPVTKKATIANVLKQVEIVNDTSPQLGGDLDLNGSNIDFPTTANISDCLDEDDMATDSATMLATQQSIKKYVDDNRINPFRIIQAMPPSANAATIDYRAGGSTPAEQFQVWDFDDTAAEYMDFKCRLLGYGGGGLTFNIAWSSEDQTSGACQWEIAIRRIASDAEDIDTSHSYVFNTVSDTTASATGELIYSTIAFTDGADMDSWADGEMAIVRVRRNPDGTDTLINDAEFHALFGKET